MSTIVVPTTGALVGRVAEVTFAGSALPNGPRHRHDRSCREVLHLHVVDQTTDDSKPESLVPAQVDAINPVVVPGQVCQVEGEFAVGVGGLAANGVRNLDGEGFGVLDEPQLDRRRGRVGQIETHGERARFTDCKLDLVEHVVGDAGPPSNGSGDEAGGPHVLG